MKLLLIETEKPNPIDEKFIGKNELEDKIYHLSNLHKTGGILKSNVIVSVDKNSEIKNVGDWCLFYGDLSKVLEIHENGKTVKIETFSKVSKEDAETINSIKGKIVIEAGSFSSMIHSFSKSQLIKIVSSNSKEITPNNLINNSEIEYIIKYYNLFKELPDVY